MCHESIIILEQLHFSLLEKQFRVNVPYTFFRWTCILSVAPNGITLAPPQSSKNYQFESYRGASIAITIKGFVWSMASPFRPEE